MKKQRLRPLFFYLQIKAGFEFSVAHLRLAAAMHFKESPLRFTLLNLHTLILFVYFS